MSDILTDSTNAKLNVEPPEEDYERIATDPMSDVKMVANPAYH